jgi:AcrR family transcriptional regulator
VSAVSAPIKVRRGRPLGGGGDETRRKILDVALIHFAERGFTSATLSAIAKDAGIAPSAMYHYFDGKESLYEAVFFDVAPAVWASISARIVDAPTVRQAVEMVLRDRGGARSPSITPFLAALPTVAVLHPEFEHLLTARAELQSTAFRAMAEIGMRTGELRGFTLDEATEILRSIVMGWFFERYFGGAARDTSIDTMLKAFDRILDPPRVPARRRSTQKTDRAG